MITFYTAKQTRWGLNGLEVIRAREVGVLDACIAIVRAFDGAPVGREWLSIGAEPLVQKVAGFLKGFGVNRQSHLLIIDNAETMAQSTEDTQSLAIQLQELSKRVGRVLLTSRRREAIEARPIEIKPLTVDESIAFLRSRAKALQRQPVLQAGMATLRKFANGLGNKPLVLEVFIQALNGQEISLQRAFDRVTRMQRQDLGEFLYSDAWTRFRSDMRHLLLLMTRIADIHDDFLLKLCCMQVGISAVEAMEAFEESRGIASISQVGGHLQIVFSPEFMQFCKERTISIEGVSLPSEKAVQSLIRRYNEFLRSSSTKVKDKVSMAYRHVLARAAWLAFQERRFDDCELFYEEAILADSSNGWLFDRYAYFLLSRGRPEEALEKASIATGLIGDDPEAWFTRGMIEARAGLTGAARTSLGRSLKNGKPKHLYLLQLAYANLNDSPPDKANARANVDESERSTPPQDPYRWKHLAEIERLRNRIGI